MRKVHLQAILFMALNAVLNTVGVSITRPQNNDEWSIQDGRSLTRFRDGVVCICSFPVPPLSTVHAVEKINLNTALLQS